MFSRLKTAFAAGALTFAAAAPASAAVIFSDSFESPSVNTWQVFQTGVGDTGAWNTVIGAGIEIQNESIGITDAYDGEQYVELDSDNCCGGTGLQPNSAMGANVNFVEGQQYLLSFAYKPRTNVPGDNIIGFYTLNLNGTTFTQPELHLVLDETTATLSDWTVYTILYTAKAGVNALGFAAGNDAGNTFGGFLDYVRVEEVPIPAALPLFGAGLASFAAFRRRKRKAVAA